MVHFSRGQPWPRNQPTNGCWDHRANPSRRNPTPSPSAEWKAWLEAFAAKMRSKPTAIIDLGLAKLAAQEGFSEPPPRIPS